MGDTNLMVCDGCGQFAPPAHIARRLQRLEWASRYRPVHVQTALLGAMVPAQQGAYLYADSEDFSGEASKILQAVEISPVGKPREGVLTEFQKRGLVLMHVMECPLESGLSVGDIKALLERQLKSTMTRIRRSVMPKRVLIFSKEMTGLTALITEKELEVPVLLHEGKPFELTEADGFAGLRAALGSEFSLLKK